MAVDCDYFGGRHCGTPYMVDIPYCKLPGGDSQLLGRPKVISICRCRGVEPVLEMRGPCVPNPERLDMVHG